VTLVIIGLIILVLLALVVGFALVQRRRRAGGIIATPSTGKRPSRRKP
jgi:hypothetical protein